jgi:signal transduction histidine kinase
MFQNKSLSAVTSNLLFRGVGDVNLDFNFNPKDFIEIGEGEIIYQSGDPSDCLYLIIEGEIKLKIPGGVSSPFILRKANNDFFGEKEVQENTVRKSSAVAEKDTLIYLIRKNDLNSMVQRSKELGYNLLGYLKEDNETETDKKGKVFNGLIKKLSEKPFFKSEDKKSVEETKNVNSEVIGNNEEETKNETESDYEAELKEVSEEINETKVIYEVEAEIKNERNFEDLDYSNEKPDSDLKTDDKKSDPEKTNLPPTSLIDAFLKIFSDINSAELFISISEAISDLLNAEKGKLYIIDAETDELRTRIKIGTEHSDLSIKFSGNLFSESVNEDKIIIINYPSEEQLTLANLDSGVEVKNLIICPIKDNQSKIIGVLQLINSKKGKFDPDDEKLISELSPLIALAIDNSAYIQDLIHSDRLISLNKMANFLIHDINNPIVTIKQYSEHIKKQSISNEIKLILDMIVEQANCVVDLVQTTLGYSEGKALSNPQPIMLTSALDYILSMLAEYVESRNVKLFKKFEGDGWVNLDKKEFYQACFQIAKNACDAMPQGGNFYIITRREGDKIRIEFKDTGLGIPGSIKDRIFEPFMTHGKKQESGLGLAIAEKIIKEHNGMIWAESDLGEGAVLIIVLPVLD